MVGCFAPAYGRRLPACRQAMMECRCLRFWPDGGDNRKRQVDDGAQDYAEQQDGLAQAFAIGKEKQGQAGENNENGNEENNRPAEHMYVTNFEPPQHDDHKAEQDRDHGPKHE